VRPAAWCWVLLARAGVDVIVLEKHADSCAIFARHGAPSTLEIIYELGLLDEFLNADQELKELRA